MHQSSSKPHLGRDTNTTALLIQIAGVACVLILTVGAAWSIWLRLKQQGYAQGFDILLQPTGFSIVSPLLRQSALDPYWWTLLVAIANTAAVSLLAIVATMVCGTIVGVGLTSSNDVIKTVCKIYAEGFRNIPLILQVMFWYMSFMRLPTPQDHAAGLMSSVFMTNKGLFFPKIVVHSSIPLLLISFAVLIALLAAIPAGRHRMKAMGLPRYSLWLIAGGALLASAGSLFFAGSIDRPRLHGFSFEGGATLSLEFLTLTFSIVVFSSAYTAEIVRGGLDSVPRGQREAAEALGLSPLITFVKVAFPIALRSMIPSLGNQFTFIIKATALGLAIGYSDLFSFSVLSISQSGETVEFLVTMMVAYLVLNYSMTLLMHRLDRTLSFKGRLG